MDEKEGGFMKKICLLIAILLISGSIYGQNGTATFTGTVVIYGSGFNTRTITAPFTLRLNGQTSQAEIDRLVGVLRDGGQDKLLDELNDEKVGSFSIGARVARDVNAAHVTTVDGKTRIRAVFARWLGFGELRGGYRSVDYPFTYLELFIDPRTGKGEGTFIAAARIRFREKDGADQIEIEDFGTFPGRLMGVQMRGRIAG